MTLSTGRSRSEITSGVSKDAFARSVTAPAPTL